MSLSDFAGGEFRSVIYEPGPIARVILNRPERQNAQSWRMLREMELAFNGAVADPECRVIVLSGAGRSFSAGHDLESDEQRDEARDLQRPLDQFARGELYRDIYIDSHLRWRNLTKPTIAMIHGYCIFGGWMIAAAMDVIFAAEDALFIPVYGDYFTTTWDVGARKAKEILFGNKFMTAEEAMQWGFVNRVVPRDDLESQTLTYAARVAENSARQNRTIKFAINQTLDMMGFSTSVRALHPDFNGRNFGRPAEGERPAPAPAPTTAPTPQGQFRSQVGRAMEYAREDGLIAPKPTTDDATA
jgi:enoyl-CoA hydratase